MRCLFLALCVALLVFATGCNTQTPTPDPVATQSWTMAQLHNFAGQQKPINDQVRQLDKSLKDGTAKLNVDSIKTKSLEADEVVVSHGGKFELRSGARFVRDGKEEDSSKPPPKPGPDPVAEALRQEVEALKVRLKMLEASKAAPSGSGLDDFQQKYLEEIRKIREGRDSLEQQLKKLQDFNRKVGEELDKAVRPQPVMPSAKNGGPAPEAKADFSKAWSLGDSVPAALIPIAERRLRKTIEDYQMAQVAIGRKVAELQGTPWRMQWPQPPNSHSPTVYL